MGPAPARPWARSGRSASRRVNRIMGRYDAGLSETLAAMGLTTPEMRTLAVLSVTGPLTVGEAAVYAVVEPSTMSRTLDALGAAGLVRRQDDPADSRARRVSPTEAGREAFDGLRPALAVADAGLFAGIPDEERDRLIGTLREILRDIRRNPF